MEKFLSIPVLDPGAVTDADTSLQLVSISGGLVLNQVDADTLTITYSQGKVVTLNYDAAIVGSAAPVLLLHLQDAIEKALISGWSNPVHEYIPYGCFITNDGVTKTFNNPMTSITIA